MLKAKPGNEKALEEAVMDMMGKVCSENGTIDYAFHRHQTRPGLFFLYEKTNQPEAKAELYKSMMDIYGKDSSILQQIVELYSKNKNYEKSLIQRNDQYSGFDSCSHVHHGFL